MRVIQWHASWGVYSLTSCHCKFRRNAEGGRWHWLRALVMRTSRLESDCMRMHQWRIGKERAALTRPLRLRFLRLLTPRYC
jgi:hypothetical protein